MRIFRFPHHFRPLLVHISVYLQYGGVVLNSIQWRHRPYCVARLPSCSTSNS